MSDKLREALRQLVNKFSDLAVEMEKHSNDHIHDYLRSDRLAAAVEGVCADRINAILKPARAALTEAKGQEGEPHMGDCMCGKCVLEVKLDNLSERAKDISCDLKTIVGDMGRLLRQPTPDLPVSSQHDTEDGSVGHVTLLSSSGAARDEWMDVAREFHEAYERIAPTFDYETRPETKVSWEQLPVKNKYLMAATVRYVVAPLLEQIRTAEKERTWDEAYRVVWELWNQDDKNDSLATALGVIKAAAIRQEEREK